MLFWLHILDIGRQALLKKGLYSTYTQDIKRLVGGEFLRIRIGVGRPTFKGDEANYVLSPFSDSEIKILEPVLKKSVEAVDLLISAGLEKAQQQCQLNPR